MKQYTKPALTVERFDEEDIIVTSLTAVDNNNSQAPSTVTWTDLFPKLGAQQ